MGNVIPWSQIHPSIKTEEPFVAVVIVDPQREICISEMVEFELEALANPDMAAPELIAAAQSAAAKVASGYRTRRKQTPSPVSSAPIPTVPARRSQNPSGLRVLNGGRR
ncbi:MAG: hypothetical protein E6I84_07730 [Chloroflexi bacterium]|nr:MAG: hypothetical protein E6I84_07730 [Chloroflexota bacterium]